MKYVLKTVVILAVGVVAGYLLLVLVFCLPLGRVHNNVVKSASSFDGEYSVLVHDNLATREDDWTDALMLMTAENSEDRNPFTASIYAYHSVRDGVFPHALIRDLNNPENKQAQYSRYWHGYLLLLKPLLMFMTYNQIQILVSFAVLALVIGVIYLLQKKKLDKYIIPYGVTVAVMSPVAILISMQFFAVFAIFNMSILYILWRHEKIYKKSRFFYMFLVIGMITCYFDFLTYPVVTLGIPLVIYLILSNKDKAMGLGKNIMQVAVASVGWTIGYFGIWVGKWALGSLITGENLFSNAMNAAESRASASAFSEEISRLLPIQRAFEVIFTEPFCIVLVLMILLVVVLLAKRRIRFNREKALNNLWMLVVALIPFVWYIVFANHSESHVFFTYRTMSILIFAACCYVVSIMEKRTKKIRKEKKVDG